VKWIAALFFALFLTDPLGADIVLPGQLHAGNNTFDDLAPPDPLTLYEYSRLKDGDGNLYITMYPYYPTRFYLTEETRVSGVALRNVRGFYDEGNLWVEIDGKEYGPGDDNVTAVTFAAPITLGQGMHTIAVHGSCFYRGDEVACDADDVDDVDDFDFDAIVLVTGQTTLAWHDVTRHHTGDSEDDNDNLDYLGNSDYKPFWYPDDAEDSEIDEPFAMQCPVSGIDFFVSRLRDIDKNGINTFVFDPGNGDDAVTFDLDADDDEAHDLWLNLEQSYPSLQSATVRIKSGWYSDDDRDDFSWDGVVAVPRCRMAPRAEYRMDACLWSGASGEVVDASGHGYDGRAVRATTGMPGLLCRDGNFSVDSQEAESEDEIDHVEIPEGVLDGLRRMTVMMWVNLPRVEDRFQVAMQAVNADGGQRFRINFYPYDDTTDRIAVLLNAKVKAFYLKDDARVLGQGWHHVAFRTDGTGNGCLFVDGEFRGCRYHEEWAKALDVGKPIFLGAKYINDYKNNDLLGEMDEVKFFDYPLPWPMITAIYENEKGGKNADGSARECPDCPPPQPAAYRFDAWDTRRSIEDRNISTKEVAGSFELSVASLTEAGDGFQEFNGSVCLQPVRSADGTPLGGWVRAQFAEANISTAAFSVPVAAKDARVRIAWKRDVDEGCPLENEENSTLSSDNFAVRPHAYLLRPSGAPYHAGREFNLSLTATTAGGDAAPDYNETVGSSFRLWAEESRSDCLTGTLAFDPFAFADGTVDGVGLSYSEVGEISLRIGEINGSEFAAVDRDDTNDSIRLIAPASVTAAFGVDHFEVNATTSDFSDGNFTYLSRDLRMAASVDLAITAKNGRDRRTDNYTDTCYAEDVNLSLDHTPVPSGALGAVGFYLRDANGTDGATSWQSPLSDPLAVTVGRENFSPKNLWVDANGTTRVRLFFNFDRNASRPAVPFDFALTEIDAADTKTAAAARFTAEGNATFFYGRLTASDVETTENNVTDPVRAEVYEARGYGFVRHSLHWYSNGRHDTADYGTVREANVTAGVLLGVGEDDTIEVGWGTWRGGHLPLWIVATGTEPVKRTVHLGIDPWLWYVPEGFGGPYRYESGSDCTAHPCFTYERRVPGTATAVRSGDFNGSDFDARSLDANATYRRRQGVKLFR